MPDEMPYLMHDASRKAEEFVDQFGNCFIRLAAFPSLFLSVALDIFNLRKARW
jgi:hypothetical protein